MGSEIRNQTQTDDEFQSWIFSLFDWEIAGKGDQKLRAPPASNPPYEGRLPNGNYSSSCRWRNVDKNGILEAECRTLNGEYHYSTIYLKSIITSLNGKFLWLDETIRSPGGQKSYASDWKLLGKAEIEARKLPVGTIKFPVIGECTGGDGKPQTFHLELDERITNDNGRLKLVTPLGQLTIPMFTNYLVSFVAIAMIIDTQQQPPIVASNDIEEQVECFLRSHKFAKSAKNPLAESLDTKAATLVSHMWIRFCCTYEVGDLINYKRICEAICHRLRKRKAPPPSHELKVLLDHFREVPSHLKSQALALVESVQNRRQIFLINEAIHVLQMERTMIDEGDDRMPLCSQELCQMTLFRYEATSDFKDLQTACDSAKKFLDTYTKDDRHKALALSIFAKCKWEEDRLSGEQKNGKVIVEALQKAESCSIEKVEKQMIRGNLYTYRLQNASTLNAFNYVDLDHAIESLKDAAIVPAFEGQKIRISLVDKIARLRNLARCLCLAFQAKPNESSRIQEAIDTAEKSLCLCKDARAQQVLSDQIFADALATYAQALATRSKISENSDDLGQIIKMYQEAVVTISNSRGRAEILHPLALHQLLWYERKEPSKTDGAIQSSTDQVLPDAFENAKEAYESPSPYSEVRGVYAHTFIRALIWRHGTSIAAIDKAIQIAAETLTILAPKDDGRTLLEATRCELFFQRFLLEPSASSYDKAMEANREHNKHRPLEYIDGPHQVIGILRLAMQAFRTKFGTIILQTDQYKEDMTFMKQQCEEILNLDGAQTRHCVEASIILGLLLVASMDWIAANDVLEKTIRLFRRLITRSLSRTDQEWLLKRFSTDLPTIAGFVALCAAKTAGSSPTEVVVSCLQRLESSRGMLARFVFQSRLNLSHLRSADKIHAEEYAKLLEELTLLDAAVSVDENQPSKIDKRGNLDVIQQRDDLAERISRLEDSMGQMEEVTTVDAFKKTVGKSALVYVVANSDTSIALLVTEAGLSQVELHELKAVDVTQKLNRLYGNDRLSEADVFGFAKAGRELSEILKWLWDVAVKPILTTLAYYPEPKRRNGNRLPRLWWCGCGITSKLPFHAAGEGAKGENIYDYAVPSFTASLMGLQSAQGCPPPSKTVLEDYILAVSMPTTPEPDWADLNTEEELKQIKDAAQWKTVPLINPGKHDVVQKIREHSIIHFICHGSSITNDPSSSALLLGQREAKAAERLTVQELGAVSLGKAQIAYLSACSTAENSNYQLSDESIYLASAFQLAGFSHVIAAFWEVKDQGGIVLAGWFYKKLSETFAEENIFESDHDRVAYALYDALFEVRKDSRLWDRSDTVNPLFWSPFIHIGA